MPFDDTLADCQPDAGAGNLFTVQTLEHPENFGVIRRIDPHAVIRYGEAECLIHSDTGNVDSRTRIAAILDGIPNQVLKQLNKMRRVTEYRGQVFTHEVSAA